MSNKEVTTPRSGAEVPFTTWVCILCGFVYDEAAGLPDHGLPAGTRWSEVPEDWICPDCSGGKADFEMVEV